MPEPEKIYFTGVSLTDENGQAMSSPDPTDWRWDDQWTAAEIVLFPGASASLCAGPDSLILHPAFPNPAHNALGLHFISSPRFNWDFRIVDENLQIIFNLDDYAAHAGSNNISLDVSQLSVTDTLRLYYQARSSNCVYRGHGDVIKQ